MSEFMDKVSGLFSGFKKAAGDAVESSEIRVAKGKIAGKPVIDNAGQLIVDVGQLIDDAVIERARAAGKLGAVAGAAVTSQAQDFKEKARAGYAATPDGVEAHSLNTADAYSDARRYIGRYAAVDVTDIRGNIIVAAGTKIEDEHVRAAREADQLATLVYSAEQSPPSPAPIPAVAPGTPSAPAASTRTARPLNAYYEDEE